MNDVTNRFPINGFGPIVQWGKAGTLGLVAALACVSCGPPEPIDSRARVPVLFVHGSGLGSDLWKAAIRHMKRAGHDDDELLAIDMLPADGSNPQAASLFIEPAVERLLQQAAQHARRSGRESPERVDIVAHSMGAVSARWYATFLRPDRVRLLVGVAPANHGTDALCGHPGTGNQELCPAFASDAAQSAVQVKLNGSGHQPVDSTAFGLGRQESFTVSPDASRCIAYLTVRIEPDEWIKPERSAVLEGAGGLPIDTNGLDVVETSPGNYLFVMPTIHDDLPKQPQIGKFIERATSAADDHYRSLCPRA